MSPVGETPQWAGDPGRGERDAAALHSQSADVMVDRVTVLVLAERALLLQFANPLVVAGGRTQRMYYHDEALRARWTSAAIFDGLPLARRRRRTS
jgi:hypothetical protein